MRVSVYFYDSVDTESVVWRNLNSLVERFGDVYHIGGNGGFGVENLSWHDATKLTAQIANVIYKADCASVFKEFRLLMQTDVAETASLFDRYGDQTERHS